MSLEDIVSKIDAKMDSFLIKFQKPVVLGVTAAYASLLYNGFGVLNQYSGSGISFEIPYFFQVGASVLLPLTRAVRLNNHIEIKKYLRILGLDKKVFDEYSKRNSVLTKKDEHSAENFYDWLLWENPFRASILAGGLFSVYNISYGPASTLPPPYDILHLSVGSATAMVVGYSLSVVGGKFFRSADVNKALNFLKSMFVSKEIFVAILEPFLPDGLFEKIKEKIISQEALSRMAYERIKKNRPDTVSRLDLVGGLTRRGDLTAALLNLKEAINRIDDEDFYLSGFPKADILKQRLVDGYREIRNNREVASDYLSVMWPLYELGLKSKAVQIAQMPANKNPESEEGNVVSALLLYAINETVLAEDFWKRAIKVSFERPNYSEKLDVISNTRSVVKVDKNQFLGEEFVYKGNRVKDPIYRDFFAGRFIFECMVDYSRINRSGQKFVKTEHPLQFMYFDEEEMYYSVKRRIGNLDLESVYKSVNSGNIRQYMSDVEEVMHTLAKLYGIATQNLASRNGLTEMVVKDNGSENTIAVNDYDYIWAVNRRFFNRFGSHPPMDELLAKLELFVNDRLSYDGLKVLLHGDVTHRNILQGGYLVDYETSVFLGNPMVDISHGLGEPKLKGAGDGKDYLINKAADYIKVYHPYPFNRKDFLETFEPNQFINDICQIGSKANVGDFEAARFYFARALEFMGRELPDTTDLLSSYIDNSRFSAALAL